MMRRRFLIAVPGSMALLGGLAGGISAYVHGSGSGSGAATVGTASPVTVQAVTSGTPMSSLVPGGSADLLVQVSNPNSFAVTIVAIAPNGPVSSVVGGNGCTVANSGVSVPTQTGLSIAVGPGTQVVHIAGGATMSTSSFSGCQGASFQVPAALTVQR